MIGACALLHDGEGALVEGAGGGVVALVVEQGGELIAEPGAVRVFCALEGGSGGMAEVRKHCGESSGRRVMTDTLHSMTDGTFYRNLDSIVYTKQLNKGSEEAVKADRVFASRFQEADFREPLECVFSVETGVCIVTLGLERN